MPQLFQARPQIAELGENSNGPSWPHTHASSQTCTCITTHLRIVVLHCLPQHLVLPLAGRHHHPPRPPDAGVGQGPIPCNLAAGVHNNHALLEAVRK